MLRTKGARAGLFLVPLALAQACASGGSGSGQDAGAGSPDGQASSSSSSGSPASSSGSSSGGSSSSSGGSSSGASSSSSGASSSSGGVVDASVGDGSASTDCASLPFCDGFENDTVGSPPSAAQWSLVTGCGMNDPTSTVTVVSNATHPAHSGMNSVQVVGGNNTCGPLFINSTAFQTPGIENSLYGRFWVELSTALPATHVALMALGLGADAGDPTMLQISQELQLTAQYNVFVWNYRDTTLPDMAPGFDPPINTWTCVEFHTDMATGELDTWIGGNAIPEMTFVPGTTAVQTGTNDHWSSGRPQPLVVSSAGFGWVNFGGGPSTLWFDDIAFAATRIGCN